MPMRSDSDGRPARIVHLITDLDRGGAEAALVRLVARLDRRRFANTIISLTDCGTHGRKLDALGVRVVALGLKSVLSAPLALWQLRRTLIELQPDILQTWLFHADLAGLLVGRTVGVPAICWNIRCSDLSPDDSSRSLLAMISILAKLSNRPDCVIVNSEAGHRSHVAIGYRPRRWELIPNGFDTSEFAPSSERRREWRQRLGWRDDEPVVGMVARHHRMKDHATFIEAIALVAQSKPDVRVLMAGKNIDRSNPVIMNALAASNMERRFALCGDVDETAALFPTLDVAVSSSYSEAFPNVVGEAMACGVPCVVTDAGDSARIVGDTGIVVPPRNPVALAAAIVEVLSLEQSERAALGLRGRARIMREFSIDAIVGRYEQLYDELAPMRAGSVGR